MANTSNQDDSKNNLGTWLLNRRTAMNLSRAAVADKIGVSYNSIGLWERGQRCPKLDKATAIEKLFGPMPEGIKNSIKKRPRRIDESKLCALGKWLQQQEVRMNWLRDQAAKALGIAVKGYWKLKQAGGVAPSPILILRIEKLFGLIPEEIKSSFDSNFPKSGSFARWLLEQRFRVNMSRRQAALKTNLKCYNSWEEGRAVPTYRDFARIENIYGPIPDSLKNESFKHKESLLSLKQWLVHQRQWLGLTREEAVKKFADNRITVDKLGHWERGNAVPSKDLKSAFEKLYGTLPEDVLSEWTINAKEYRVTPLTEWLRACRRQLQLTLEEVAERIQKTARDSAGECRRCHVNGTAVMRWEQGNCLPDPSNFYWLSKIYGEIPEAVLAYAADPNGEAMDKFNVWMRMQRLKKGYLISEMAEYVGKSSMWVMAMELKQSWITRQNLETIKKFYEPIPEQYLQNVRFHEHDICEWLRKLRQLLAWSKRNMAAEIGVTLWTYSCWETGAAKPQQRYIPRLQALFDAAQNRQEEQQEKQQRDNSTDSEKTVVNPWADWLKQRRRSLNLTIEELAEIVKKSGADTSAVHTASLLALFEEGKAMASDAVNAVLEQLLGDMSPAAREYRLSVVKSEAV